MVFHIKKNPIIIFGMFLMLLFIVISPAISLILNEQGWLMAFVAGILCLAVNIIQILDIFVFQHKIINGELVTGYWLIKKKIPLASIRVIRFVGKSKRNLEVTYGDNFEVHMITMPKEKEKFMELLLQGNPYVRIEN